MKEIWRRSVVLIRQHPVLWIPVLCADLVGFLLRELEKAAGHQIVVWLMLHTHSSVFGGAPDLPAQQAIRWKAVLLTAPLLWGSYFVSICLYAVSLVMTAGLVGQILEEQQPQMEAQIGFVQEKTRSVLSVSGKVLGTVLGVGIAMVLSALPLSEKFSALTIGLASGVAIYLATAFLITPAALRMIAPHPLRISPEGIGLARTFAAAAVTVSATATYLYMLAANSMRASNAGNAFGTRMLTEALGSSMIALPYVPLFVGLSLVAREALIASAEPV